MSSAMQAVSQSSPAQVAAQYPPALTLQPTPSPQSSRPAQTIHLTNNAIPSPHGQHLHSPHSASPAMSSPREYIPSTHGSPAATSPAPSGGNPRSRPRDMLGGPPIPPPRTSSNKGSYTNSNASSRERVGSSKHGRRRNEDNGRDRERGHAQTQAPAGPRQQPQQQQQLQPPAPQTEWIRGDITTSPGRSRRRVPHSPEGPQRAGSTREPRDHSSAGATASSSEGAMAHSASATSGPGGELGTVLNRMVITDPEEDIVREQQRQAEARAEKVLQDESEEVEAAEASDTRVKKSRHDYSNSKRKETTFGDYILGQTIGEGEFGKVKIGWKRDGSGGSVQVAIKLLRRESLGTNPGRLPKIHREISILRDLSHPNIVRLHEMVETDKHIGIILEYASGGELFDYILNHRYLKDNAARRLFAQLVSGVGYLHKKGIVHRDLKLENLLLDRNRNIIITDFGFANTFNPADELGEEIEYNLTNREFVKRFRLDLTNEKGQRRGDLMQTSCGSPCYAAPELVVSDSLYTGRKVDVWSCGVILYAMLAGYLPFDDDPANPDGDNINLLYKYIVTTPLTFPEYVTPHACDLLRRILVPDPRKRADLFEVARHSWLAEYAHVVSYITSNTTNLEDIANSTVPSEDQEEPSLARSASVRVPPRQYNNANVTPVGGLGHQQGQVSQPEDRTRSHRDAKRRTVQVEYVAPQSQTARGDPASKATSRPSSSHRTAARTGGRDAPAASTAETLRTKPLPVPPPGQEQLTSQAAYSSSLTQRDQGTVPQTTRPQTGGSVASASGQPSRGTYSQPAAPAVAATNAQGRLAQPRNGRPHISAPIPLSPSQIPTSTSIGLSSAPQPSSVATSATQESFSKGHKRSSTVTSISEKLFGRGGSMFGSRSAQQPHQRPGSPGPVPGKRYPPTSMKEPFVGSNPRASMDSRRSLSYGFRKQTDPSKPRRFSLLPPSFSLKSFSAPKDQPPSAESQMAQVDAFVRPQTQQTNEERRLSTAPAATDTTTQQPQFSASHGTQTDDAYTNQGGRGHGVNDARDLSAQIDRQFAALHSSQGQFRDDAQGGFYQPPSTQAQYHQPPAVEGQNYASENGSRPSMQTGRQPRHAVLQRPNRKFADAYEYERSSHHSGSSGAARKVMDFFRRRGKARAGEDG